MSETIKPAAAPPPPAREDLSKAIDEAIDKLPGEAPRTVHLFGDLYRCNWWTNLKPVDWLAVTTGKISRSKFLRVTMSDDKLVIVDVGERR